MEDEPTPAEQFEILVKERRDVLIGALGSMLDTAQAEEVAQEACLRVLQVLDRIDRENLAAYWFRSARNIALSRLRRERVSLLAEPLLSREMELRIAESDSGLRYESDWERSLMLEAINAMPPVCRNVFIYRKMEGRSHREIATLMGISVNTVQNHLASGMKFCRRYVREALDESLPATLGQAAASEPIRG